MQAPPGVFTGWQVDDTVLQKNPAVHWMSVVHPPWHAAPLHGTVAPHATGVWDVHAPPWQVAGGIAAAFGMIPEHEAGTPQPVPFVTGVLQTPPWQVSTVHGLPSLVQATPFPRVVWTQPVAATQESVVQLLLSAHARGAPG